MRESQAPSGTAEGDSSAARALRDPLIAVCALALVAGVVLPWIHLGRTPFWVDECIAALPARAIHRDLLPTSPFDLDFMPWQIQRGLWDPATPLYRYALAGFTAVFGFSEYRARSFSVLFGLASAGVLFALARRLFDARVAFASAAVLVTSSTFLIHAREARHFTFVIFLSLTTLLLLHRSSDERRDLSAALWPPFAVATLLAQTLGYGLLAVAAPYALLVGPRRVLRARWIPVYLLAGAVYAAIVGTFWSTLPFFHETSCANRPEGCHPERWYYVRVLYEFLAPMREQHVRETWRDVSPLPPLLFAIGLAVAGWHARGRRREDSLLLALWTLGPFLLLSLQEVKFARYLFIWLMPICALYVGVGIVAVGSALRRASPRGLVEALLLILVILGPRWSRAGGYEPWRFQLGLVDYARRSLLDAPVDSWERIAWQTAFLRQHTQPGDIVVTSFDDACLGFYLDRFVYGFLNSRRTDAFFVGLLTQAKQTHATVWLVDTLPELDLCYESDEAVKSVDCRLKYARFYQSCLDPAASGAPCRTVVP